MCFKKVKRTKIEKGLAVCREVEAKLPLPKNGQEDKDLYKIVRGFGVKGAALDGTDIEKEGDWRDSAGKALTYTNWGKDQPSNAYGNENYLHYWDTLNGKHNDAAGSLEENIICVKPLSGKIYFEPKSIYVTETYFYSKARQEHHLKVQRQPQKLPLHQ